MGTPPAETVKSVWTRELIEAEGAVMQSVTAAKIVHLCGETTARSLLRSGQDLGFRVFKVGRKYTTPTADVLRLLFPAEEPRSGGDAAA